MGSLQSLFKDVDFKSAENEFGGTEDLAAFLLWSTTPPQDPRTRKVIFRVEGHDDKLLLHALLGLKFDILQRPPNHNWRDFTYACSTASVQMRDRKVVTDQVHDVSIVSFIRSLQASAKVKRNPRGVVGVFELAAQMMPDVIFLISDASFQWKEGGSLGDVPWEEIAKIVKGSLQGKEGCTLNFIGFEMKPEDRRKMESVVRSTHGKIRVIK